MITLYNFGPWQGLADPDFQIIGGSNYVKRAVYATFELGGMSATNFDQAAGEVPGHNRLQL